VRPAFKRFSKTIELYQHPASDVNKNFLYALYFIDNTRLAIALRPPTPQASTESSALCHTDPMNVRKRARRHRSERSGTVGQPVNLKALADHLGLSPATLSLVLNRAPGAKSISRETKQRIFEAARKFSYHPNFVARALRARRSYTIGVIVPEVSEGYEALVLSGIEDYLLQAGYVYFVASHRHRADLIDEYPRLLLARSVEGLILVDTPCHHALPVPVVTVSAHTESEGFTSIELDHHRAATLVLQHLVQLGHRRIAIIKGQSFSSDTEVRWQTLAQEASRLGLESPEELTAQLVGDSPSPFLGYVATQKLLASTVPFTALVAFNDVSAIGAIRALREAGRRVPEDVSVVGFDDIQSAAFQNPALTTVRQPLWKMGALAAETLLKRIAAGAGADYPRRLTVEPELVVRESTGPAPAQERSE
jgi:DNA-binding LacI/PurR family transcriptional regulator